MVVHAAGLSGRVARGAVGARHTTLWASGGPGRGLLGLFPAGVQEG